MLQYRRYGCHHHFVVLQYLLRHELRCREMPVVNDLLQDGSDWRVCLPRIHFGFITCRYIFKIHPNIIISPSYIGVIILRGFFFFKNCFMYYSAITLDDILNGVTSSQYLSKGINTKNQPHLVSNLYIVLVDFDHCWNNGRERDWKQCVKS